jgi:hypothetical protein
MRIGPETLLPLPTKSPPLCHRTGASRANSLLGGGTPIITDTVGAITGTRASPKAALTIANYRPNRAVVTRFPSTVSTTVSEQIGALSIPRPRRKNPCRF